MRWSLLQYLVLLSLAITCLVAIATQIRVQEAQERRDDTNTKRSQLARLARSCIFSQVEREGSVNGVLCVHLLAISDSKLCILL